MRDREMIGRLRELRQQREQRSKEAAMRRHAAANRAAHQTQKAIEAIAAHEEQTSSEEGTAFEGLLGQPMSARNLHRIRGKVERAADEAARLEENGRAARAAEEERKVELVDARRRHHAHLRAITKLDKLMEHLGKRAARRQTALAELGEEEEHRSAPASAAFCR